MSIPPASVRPAFTRVERAVLLAGATVIVAAGLVLIAGPGSIRAAACYGVLRTLPGGLATVGVVFVALGLSQLYFATRDLFRRG